MTEEKNPLYPPRFSYEESNPFNGDLFERRKLSEQLTGYLERLNDGTVIAIDAPWGEGKSWFGRNWAADLKSQDYRVVYLDAFQQDYVEDPFLLIASEINELISTSDTSVDDLKQTAAKVMKAILPLSTKVLLNISGRVVLGTADVSEEVESVALVAGDNAADTTQKWVENKIEAYSDDKKSLESFRSALQEFCKSQDKPVVFFIDELDRCRPDFSVKLIERLKHFFDVQNLVFVLLLNKSQLENAIEGVYGANTDAEEYLRKFIHMSLRLPKNIATRRESSNANWKYLNRLVKHYNFPETNDLHKFISDLSVFASIISMSLRDLEKGMALLALHGVDKSARYLAWPVVLKLKYPEIFHGILNEDKNAHENAVELLKTMNVSEQHQFWSKKYFLSYHASKAFGQEQLTEEQLANLDNYRPNGFWHDDDPIVFWIKRLDISA